MNTPIHYRKIWIGAILLKYDLLLFQIVLLFFYPRFSARSMYPKNIDNDGNGSTLEVIHLSAVIIWASVFCGYKLVSVCSRYLRGKYGKTRLTKIAIWQSGVHFHNPCWLCLKYFQ